MVEHERDLDRIPWDMILRIGMILVESWPDPIDLTAPKAGFGGSRREFVRTLILMQDSGWIMYEAFLSGTSPEPRFLSVTVTAKGRAKLLDLINSKLK